MFCHKCGTQNKEESKFCRNCGSSLLHTSYNLGEKKRAASSLTWKSPNTLALIAIFVAGGLIWGGIKASAYFNVASKINSAQKLQGSGDYQKSIDSINGLQYGAFTSSQKNTIESIITDDQKFISFKASFDDAITHENDTSTTNLQDTLKKLQSIDSSYPNFKDVQTEITKVQNALVVSLQNESEENKKAASAASTKAAAAQAAKAQAEADASQAQNDAAYASAKTAMQSFVNQLRNISNNFVNNCTVNTSNALKNYNSGLDYSVYIGAAISSCEGVLTDAKNLNNSFTNLPSDYVSAGNAMQWSAYYISQSISAFLSKNFAEAQSDISSASPYGNEVDTFLQNH